MSATPLSALRGRSVLVTGHTGFKGSWLCLWLAELGARVHGFALPPLTQPNAFEVMRIERGLASHRVADVRDGGALAEVLQAAAPDLIFHLAAQAIVRESYRAPLETFEINALGTAQLLDAVRRRAQPCAVVCVTSDKCYAPLPGDPPHGEDDPIGGHDPYSASKGAAELIADSYRRSFFPPERLAEHGVRLASARAGNVFGGGDWSRDRIAVDVLEGLRLGAPVALRSPGAVRPWQHVLEPLGGYLQLAAALLGTPRPELCTAFNFGPLPEDTRPVRELVALFHAAWAGPSPAAAPGGASQGSALEAPDPRAPAEASALRLDTRRAQQRLGWSPRWSLAAGVEHTIAWQRAFLAGHSDMQRVTREQLAQFEKAPPLR